MARRKRIYWKRAFFATFLILVVPLAGREVSELLLMRLAANDRLVGSLLRLFYNQHQALAALPLAPVQLRVGLSHSIKRVDRRFLSVAVDSSQIAGGHWWSASGKAEFLVGEHRTAPYNFNRPRLKMLAQGLAPAYLRIGGTEADNLHYHLGHECNDHREKSQLVMTYHRWDQINRFANEVGYEMFFTLNAGKADRDSQGRWRGLSAEALLRYSRHRRYSVGVWELGNEVNVFWITHGLGQHLSAKRYAEDVRRFSKLVEHYYPMSRKAAAAAFIWPVMGEPPPRMLSSLTRELGNDLDVLTWHYYPQQSRRCWSATRRALPSFMLQPQMLNEFDRWATYINGLRDKNAHRAEVWLGETGGAQCGGEPGISDRFISSLWWLDQLGLAARRGQSVVVRQTLSGSDYGLIDDKTLQPRPDYWSSLLWKRIMGESVLNLRLSRNNHYLRAYAHCSAYGPSGSVSLLLINTNKSQELEVSFDKLEMKGAQLYRVDAPSLFGTTLELNDRPLRVHNGTLPKLEPVPFHLNDGVFKVAPVTFAFIVLPNAAASGCR